MFSKTSLFVFLNLVSINLVNAQQTISTTGITITSNTGEISYTIGQIDYTSTIIETYGTLSEGVQQVYNNLPFTNLDKTITINAGPNPVIDNLSIKINSSNYTAMSYQIIDVVGRPIENKKIFNNDFKIDMHNYVTGIYIVIINISSQPITQFKIFKQ